MSHDECPCTENQVRGRSRPHTVESEPSAKTSLPSAARSHPESSQPGACHEKYDMSPLPQSRRGQNFDPNRESSLPVYQDTRAHTRRSRSNKWQESYKRRISLQYDEECSHGRRDSSHKSKIQSGHKIRSVLSSGENSFESSSSRSKESVQTPHYNHRNPSKRLSSHQKKPNFLRSWSKDKPESTTSPGIEELSRTNGYPGDHYTPPAEQYTHYHGDWAVGKPSRGKIPHHESGERSQRQKGYRRDRYDDSEPSSSEDGIGHVKSSMFRSNEI